MMKNTVKRVIHNLGYTVRRIPPTGGDPFVDMRRLAPAKALIFDVGANRGQSIENFRRYFDDPEIHSFEPGELAFRDIKAFASRISNVTVVNVGLGAQRGPKMFIENEQSELSSFLEPGSAAWGSVVRRRHSIELDTIDNYCERAQISHIDILKSDTQGYDLEVLKGARRMLSEKRIRLVYIEVIFSEMYEGCPRFDETFGFLADHGFTLVSFYEMHYQSDMLSWTDALFICKDGARLVQ